VDFERSSQYFNIMDTKQVNPIALSELNLALHNDFMNQVLSLANAHGAETLHIEAFAAEFDRLVSLENSIVNRDTTYVSTKSIQDLDHIRDTTLRILLGIIDYQSRSTITKKADAANVLLAWAAPYQNVERSDYRSETREINGLITKFSTEAAAAHLATLHLTEELEQLIIKNTEFDIAIQGKQVEATDRLDQTDIDTAELRKQLDTVYNDIVKTVNAFAIVQPTDELISFINNLNGVIMLTKQAAASVGKKQKKTDKTDTTPESTPESTPTDEPTTPSEEQPSE
jgi:hypothetical protein